MFAGSSRMKVDAKGRLAVPKQFRDALPDGSFISIGPELNLTIYPREEWEGLRQVLPSPLNATREQRVEYVKSKLQTMNEWSELPPQTKEMSAIKVVRAAPLSVVSIRLNGMSVGAVHG